MAKRTIPGQTSLFGEPEPPRPRGITPADVPDTLRAVAARLPRSLLHLGTSSWSFPGWVDLVYGESATTAKLARGGLCAYAQHPLLGAAGIDRTYYAPLTAEDFAVYAEAVPDDFRFLVKAPAAITDSVIRDGRGGPLEPNPTWLDADAALEQVVRPYAEGLGDKGGVLLFQLPPQGRGVTSRPEAFRERLARFFDALPPDVTYAVELRDRALFQPEHFELLRDLGVRHGYSVHPNVPSIPEQRDLDVTPLDGPRIARWMLQPGLNYEQARDRYSPFDALVDPDPLRRGHFADLCRESLAAGQRTILIANNKAEGSAPLTLFRIAEWIVERLDSGGAG